MKQGVPYMHSVHSSEAQIDSGVFDQLGVVHRSTSGYHSLFAARVLVEPYEVLAERKWGLVERDLLDEVLDRQMRFIASLHYVGPQSASPDLHLRTLALRYVFVPGARRVDVVIVGKAFAAEQGQACALANAWYGDIQALFPADYRLVPFTSERAFMEGSGQTLLQEIVLPAQTVEIRRFEMFLTRSRERDVAETHYLIYPFVWHRNGMEQVWQAMVSCSVPAVLSVTLRPTYLHEAEEIYLGQLYEAASKLSQSTHVAERVMAQRATAIHADYLRSWRQPFLVRVQAAARPKVPGALARAAGCAIAYGSPIGCEQQAVSFPGYELVEPEDTECESARDNASLLEMSEWGSDQAAPPYRRFRYLVGVKGAHCAFRLPFVPKGGIPGVQIGAEATAEKG